MLLAIAAFSLSLLGAFIVRSGVLTSVHAFAVDPERGMFILVFLLLVVGSALALYALRAPVMRAEARYEGLSREVMLLANNIVLVVSTAAVLLGTLYPLVYESLTGGGKISVGPPYFNAVFVPLMVLLLFDHGAGAPGALEAHGRGAADEQLKQGGSGERGPWPSPAPGSYGRSGPLARAVRHARGLDRAGADDRRARAGA